MNIQFRFATINDLSTLYNIESKCFPTAEAATYESIKARLSTFPKSFVLAVYENEVIGFINGSITTELALPDKLYHDVNLHNKAGMYQTIFGLDVLPEFQHKGVATKLMLEFISLAKKRNKAGLILTCKKHLITFYESFGFINKGSSNSTHGQASWYEMHLLF
jgi:ribosomal protein S18 acetylase RimI-like enzyme